MALAASAFLSATLLPGTSEAALLATAAEWPNAVISLFLVATLANTTGSIVNWWLGTHVDRFAGARWFPVSQERLAKAQALSNRYGLWILLFAWIPVIGDPLTLAAGVMRVRFLPFAALVGAGKAIRYGLLLWGLQALT
ncbi:MAG: DedA family protein [Rhizobiales bacterium]|nr:DedA family protein [Hyphomicrobiales bacterium]